jgi:type I restriction enzyme S subunit
MSNLNFVKIGDVFKVMSGGTPSREKPEYYVGGKIPWVKTGDLKGKYANYPNEHITEDALNNSSAKIFPKNTVLLAMYGATIGACSILPFDAATNQACGALLPTDSYDTNFLFYYLKYIKNDLIKKGVGGAQPNISGGIIKETLIPLMSLPQQQKIAAILDAADALRQNDKALIAKYDELTQALFLDMFGDPVSNPKGWKKTTGKKVFKLIGGAAFKSTDYSNDGIPLIRIGAVNKGYFDNSQLVFLPEDFNSRYEKYLVYPNDLLITLTGTVGKDDYGNAFSLENDFEKYFLNQRVAKITLDEFYNYTFIKFYLKQKRVKSELIGVSRGVRQANISNEDFYKLEVIQPSINIQNQFAERVALIEEQKAIAQASLVKSEELFNSLLQKAFKGELV